MNWIDEVHTKLKRNNQILFAKDSEYLQDLMLLFQEQNHRVMVLWAFDFAAETIVILEEKSKCGWHNKKSYLVTHWQKNLTVKKILPCVMP